MVPEEIDPHIREGYLGVMHPFSASDIPSYGAGIGYRSELAKALEGHESDLDVLEILVDQWRHAENLDALRELTSKYEVVTHGVSMSVAGAGAIDSEYLAFVRDAISLCGASYHSEHLAMTYIPGMDSGHLCPPILSESSLAACKRNVIQAQEELGVPLALENVTYSVSPSPDHLSGASFIAELTTATDSLILLDVTNLFVNSRNYGFSASDYLERIPMERVVHIHLAGSSLDSTGKHVDSHSELIVKEIWELAAHAASLCNPKNVIIEHDANFPDVSEILAEVSEARSMYFPGS
ncbi:DUF692 domain-containing protein [Streptomyces sp. NBC_01241]|uniref:DUF692 domain-containing protein n=1 Tax=Streptomyces sp. NBC_01241 TaxID=2903794 RepID=UPI00352E72FC|nr:DUF692 domain-containing protein [Streptomyces sp. NBC_01241]